MELDFSALTEYQRYKLMASLIVPRPIALVTTVDAEGVVNAAPFSMFNMLGEEPPIVMISINKRDGKDWGHYLRLFQTLKRLRPLLIHTRNLSGIEGQLLAACAGVRLRVHGEHGRDIDDLHGLSLKYRCLRKLLRPLIGHFIAVSKDLEAWLIGTIGARPQHVTHIGNGVDSLQFHPRLGPPAAIGPQGFVNEHAFVIGSVGRMAEVKDHIALVHAFLALLAQGGVASSRLRLVIIGDGPCRQSCLDVLRASGTAALAWLPGSRDDVARLMRGMTVFVQPSLAEGASNTVLEAMATGRAVITTDAPGCRETVVDGDNGYLVPVADSGALATAMLRFLDEPALIAIMGQRGRDIAAEKYDVHKVNAHMLQYMGVTR